MPGRQRLASRRKRRKPGERWRRQKKQEEKRKRRWKKKMEYWRQCIDPRSLDLQPLEDHLQQGVQPLEDPSVRKVSRHGEADRHGELAALFQKMLKKMLNYTR